MPLSTCPHSHRPRMKARLHAHTHMLTCTQSSTVCHFLKLCAPFHVPPFSQTAHEGALHTYSHARMHSTLNHVPLPMRPHSHRLRIKARALSAALSWQRLKDRVRSSKGKITGPPTPKDARTVLQVSVSVSPYTLLPMQFSLCTSPYA